ncbi:MAG: sigma 54-interacting transcriptional regulator [Gemmataceae bacterium]
MRQFLFSRFSGQLVGLGGLVAVACLAGSWYINRLQAELARAVRQDAAGMEAADELQLQLRHLRVHSLVLVAEPTEARRVGGRSPIRTRVRVLAAMNQDLEQLIAEGRFRGDLFYRLKEVTLRVPPLWDRAEDIPELAHHFLLGFAREAGRDVSGFAPEVPEAFRRYPWPGNGRELRGAIKEAALRTTGRTILPEFLPPGLVGAVSEGAPSARRPPTLPRPSSTWCG